MTSDPCFFLTNRMRADMLGRIGRDWRELPDAVRREHVIEYLRVAGFAKTLQEALDAVTPERGERWLGWLADFARSDEKRPSAEASVLLGGIWRRLEEHCSDALESRWDRLRFEERRTDAEERGVYEQEGRRDG